MEEDAGGASSAADAEGGPASSSQERDTVKYFLGGPSLYSARHTHPQL